MATRAAAAAPSTLDRLSTSGKIAFGLVFAVLFAALFYVGFYGDVSGQIASAKSQEGTLRDQRAKAEESKQAYQKDVDEKAKHEADAPKLKKALPDEAETASFLSQLHSIESISGVRLTSYTPQEEVVAEYYVRVPMKLTLTGKYHQLLKFIYLAGQADRITNIEELKIKNPKVDGEDVLVDAECMAIAFRGVKPGEAPKKRGPK